LVGKGLGLVDLLHLSRVSVLVGEDEERGVHQLVRDGDLLNLAAEVLLVPVSKRLVHFLELLLLLLGNLVVLLENLNRVFGDGIDLSLLVLSQVLEDKLIDRVSKDKHFVASIGVFLQNRGL